MKLSLSFSILLAFSCMMGNAQNKVKITTIEDDNPIPIEYEWMGTTSRVLTSMKLTYKKPDGFKELDKSDTFKNYPKLKEMFSYMPNCLRSIDGQFLAFLPCHCTFTPADSIGLQQYPGESFDYINRMFVYQLRAPIRVYYGKEQAEHWRKFVSYYPAEEAKSKFNADTVIRFTIALQPEDYYKKKYKYIDALFIYKKRRGFINFYCFYTDKAKENLNYYWKKVEGTLYFED